MKKKTKEKVKRILGYSVVVVLAIALLFGAFVVYWIHHDPYDTSLEGVVIPTYAEVAFPYTHTFAFDDSLPFMASAIIDVDNDGIEEVFIGGGLGQADGMFMYEEGVFVDITESVGLYREAADTTHGAAVIDATMNGYSDLFVARTSGVYFYENQEGSFVEHLLDIPLDAASDAAAIAFTDLNNDGFVDMYVSSFITREELGSQVTFNTPNYGGTSLLLLNNGDNTFTDITGSAGILYQHNTFHATFVDLNNDFAQDLVVAHDTGQVRIYRNNGDLTFTMIENPTSDDYQYPMGIAVGDYDNDGLQDLYFSNIGNTMPASFSRGDLTEDQNLNPKWLVLHNEGDFVFTDAGDLTKLADYEFSWGAVFADFNLDGLQDLIVAENYRGIPFQFTKLLRHPGRFLLQRDDGTFAPAEHEAGVANYYYGITPLVADFNDDGVLDIVHVNLDGPIRAFVSKSVENHYLKVKLPDTASSLGAVVTVVTPSHTLQEHFITSEGVFSDQTHVLFFGLGDSCEIASVEVAYADGTVDVLEDVVCDSTVVV